MSAGAASGCGGAVVVWVVEGGERGGGVELSGQFLQALQQGLMAGAKSSDAHKVLLDKIAIERERDRMRQENSDLRTILKQYLVGSLLRGSCGQDGISVNVEVLSGANPLLVVNNRSNIQQPQPVMVNGAIPVVEAHAVLANTAKMRA